jgi:hypothetical protein
MYSTNARLRSTKLPAQINSHVVTAYLKRKSLLVCSKRK